MPSSVSQSRTPATDSAELFLWPGRRIGNGSTFQPEDEVGK
jgi:hypothetical protein